MPVYEYRCTSCHKHFEIEHRMSEKRTECAQCGGPLERLISRTSFAFKGGGWYKDLYATPKPGAAEPGASSSSDSSSGSSAASSSDTSSSTSSDKPASTDKPSGGGSSSGGDKAAS